MQILRVATASQSVDDCARRLFAVCIEINQPCDFLGALVPLEVDVHVAPLHLVLREAADLFHQRVVRQDQGFQLPHCCWLQPKLGGVAASCFSVHDKETHWAWISGCVDLTVDRSMDSNVGRFVLYIAKMKFFLVGVALDLMRCQGEEIVVHP